MYKSLVLILTALFFSVKYTDLSSDEKLYSVMLPLFDMLLFIALALWFVFKFQEENKPTSSSDSGFGVGGDGGSGSDGGAC